MNARFQTNWAGRFVRVAATLAAGIPSLPGQTLSTPVSGPTQGFAFDAPSKSVRQVAGSFGAASLGAVRIGGLDFASLAPQASHGVGCAAEQCFLLSGLDSSEPQQSLLPETTGTATGASWSADGHTMALYSASGEWVRVTRGLPNAAETQTPWSTRSVGPIASVAVSNKHVALAITGDHSGVYELTETGNFVPLLRSVNASAMTFASDGDTLLVVDAGARAVTEVSLTTGLVQAWPIDAAQEAAGIQLGRDENGQAVVLIADHGAKALLSYGATSHSLTGQVDLTFAPTQLEAVGNGSYQLTSRMSEEDLVWSYTPGRGVYFVPVTPVAITRDAAGNGFAQRGVRR